MAYKAVLFDLDGTLLDTLDDLADSMNQALADRGYPTHPTESYKIFVGTGIVNLARRAIPADKLNEENVADLVEGMRDIYSKQWAAKTRPYDGVEELLAALGKRGLKLVVLSNKPDEFTKLCVKRFLGDCDFQIVQGVAEDCPPKPDPTGARRICSGLNIQPEEFLYLGDTNTDMDTATQAGMFAVGVTWGFRSAEELKEYGAKRLIDHPLELLELL